MPASLSTSDAPTARRRALGALTALAAAALLAACGGGALDPTDAPRVIRFEASSTSVFVGERVRLFADFSGGSGRIEPVIGAVTRGSEVTSPVLDAERSFRLVVERAGQPAATRSITVGVRFRDRYALAADSARMSQHAAVAAADGSVLLIGGSRGEFALSEKVDRFDPATGRVTRIGQMTQGRAGATATRLPDGRVLVAGGEATFDSRQAELVDERSGAVTAAGALSVARNEHAAVLLRNGAVLVLGGTAAGEGNTLGISRSAELWEPATQRFRRLAATMTMPRAGHSATLLPDGRVLIAGGYTAVAGYTFAEIFDPATERFTALPDALPLRANHAALATPDGRVLLLGGETAVAGVEDPVPLATALRFDPASNRFATLPELLAPRALAAGVMLPGGHALLFGGQRTAGVAAATAELYDPATGGRAIAALDRPRQGHTATRLPSGRIAIVGGENGNGFAETVQIYE